MKSISSVFFLLFLVQTTSAGCTRSKGTSAQSAVLADNNGPQSLTDKLVENRDRLILNLNKALADFETTKRKEFIFIPGLVNCRLGAKFTISIKNYPGTSKKTITAFFSNGRVLTRQLSLELNPGGAKPISIYYKISDLSFDHEIPVITSSGFSSAFPEVEIKRIYKDFATFFRGNTPEDYLQVNEDMNSQSGYLNWLYAMGDLNDYLVALDDYQKKMSGNRIR
jgi:hypothetical protein